MSRCSFEEIQKEDELLLSPEQAMQEIVDGTRRKSILGDWIPVSIQEMTQNSAITEEGNVNPNVIDGNKSKNANSKEDNSANPERNSNLVNPNII